MLNCLSPCLLKKLLFSFYQEAHMSFFLEFQSSLFKAWMKFWTFLQHMFLLMKNSFHSWNIIHCSLIEYYFWMGNFQILRQKKTCNWIKAGVKKSFPTHPPCYTCLRLISSNWVQSLRCLFSFMVVDTMIVATSII